MLLHLMNTCRKYEKADENIKQKPETLWHTFRVKKQLV